MILDLTNLRLLQEDARITFEETEQGLRPVGAASALYAIRPFALCNGVSKWRVIYKDSLGLAIFDNLEEAKRDLVDLLVDTEQERALGRQTIQPPHTQTPWGKPQHCIRYGEEVLKYSTAEHGGFKVLAQKKMPEALLASGGWYEEDCCWARVALGFPELFTPRERRLAEDTLRHWEPLVWEEFFQRELKPGESNERDQEIFLRDNRENFIVISASDQMDGTVKVHATRGGSRDPQSEERVFLIPRQEYAGRGRFGFVVDPEKHLEVPQVGGPNRR